MHNMTIVLCLAVGLGWLPFTVLADEHKDHHKSLGEAFSDDESHEDDKGHGHRMGHKQDDEKSSQAIFAQGLLYIPTTVDDSVSELKKILTPEQVEKFKSSPEEEAVTDANKWLGEFMRDKWRLYLGDGIMARRFKEDGISDPYEMSAIILRALYRNLNSKEWVLP